MLPNSQEFFYRQSRSKLLFNSCKDCTKSYQNARSYKPSEESKSRKNARSRERRNEKRIEIVKSFGMMCGSCGMKHDEHQFFDIDHKKPVNRRKNGITGNWEKLWNDRKNLQLLCPNCHREKTMAESWNR